MRKVINIALLWTLKTYKTTLISHFESRFLTFSCLFIGGVLTVETQNYVSTVAEAFVGHSARQLGRR